MACSAYVWNSYSRLFSRAAILFLLVLPVRVLLAGDVEWVAGDSGIWSEEGNWLGGAFRVLGTQPSFGLSLRMPIVWWI